MALLDDGDLAYMRATQEEAQPTLATLVPVVPVGTGRDRLGGRVTETGTPATDPFTIRIDNDPNPPEPLAVEFGVHLVRVTAPVDENINTGDQLKVSDSEVYRVVSHGDMDPWTTAQRLWAVRVVAGA